MSCFGECWGFVRRNWVHFVLFVPGAVLYTIAHEAAHGAAVVLQGGQVTEFAWIPSGNEWGHISYTFGAGVPYSRFLISVAPYVMSLMLCAVACLVAAMRKPLRPWAASTVFIWLYLVPLGDLAYAACPYAFLGAANDLLRAFGPATVMTQMVVLLGGGGTVVLGYFVQKRLYGDIALSKSAYAAMGFAALTAACVIQVGIG